MGHIGIMKSSTAEGVDTFFEARDEMTLPSHCSSDFSEESSSSTERVGSAIDSLHYDFWTEKLQSVTERRDAFIREMGFDLDQCHSATGGPEDAICDMETNLVDRNVKTDSAGQRTIEEKDFVGQISSPSAQNETWERESSENMVRRIKCLDGGKRYVAVEVGHDGMPMSLREVGSNRLLTIEEFYREHGCSEA